MDIYEISSTWHFPIRHLSWLPNLQMSWYLFQGHTLEKSVQQSNYTCRIIMQLCSLQYKINLCVLQEDEIYHAKIDLISSSSRSGV